MVRTRDFDRRIGAVHIPEAEDAIGTSSGPELDDVVRLAQPELPNVPPALDPRIGFHSGFCRTKLRQGCYTITFRPKSTTTFFLFSYQGTLRVEKLNVGYRISGDLYTRSLFDIFPRLTVKAAVEAQPALSATPVVIDRFDPGILVAPTNKIPIFPRRRYYSYLKGTGARLWSFGRPCSFTLDFDEFRYQHPASGFNGSFPTTPTRSLRFALKHTGTPDLYEGKAFEGSTEVGTVSIRRVSKYFRKATLHIHTLQGAVAPQSVPGAGGTTESFRSIFAGVGWDLKVIYASGTIPLPASLNGVQNPNSCWSSANSATLLASVPGYDPSELDKVWKARLLAIPAAMGCSRGRMFDNGTGDPNNVPREGAVTHSDDGYPAADSPNFGTAQGKKQRDVPRAFLRSAAHEVGHTFNQIHQFFELGSDNSVMTVTPSVANVLAAGGDSFPDDINLAFNDTVRRHLIHLPDPAVRPGGMAFFGSAINAPQADAVTFPSELTVEVTASADKVRLGEPLPLKWALRNHGEEAVPVPSRVDVESLTARVSVTDPQGKVTFMRPVELETCSHIALEDLAPKRAVEGETVVYYGQDGFAFETPGRHTVEVIVLWSLGDLHFAACGETTVWVAYPLTDRDNEVAALLLDPDVGCAVATGERERFPAADERIKRAVKIQEKHPACQRLKKLGLV